MSETYSVDEINKLMQIKYVFEDNKIFAIDPNSGQKVEIDLEGDGLKRSYILENKFETAAKELYEALKYYSLKSNYSVVDEGRNYNVNNVIYELDEKTYADRELGTKAKETLNKFKPIFEKEGV